MSDRVVSGAGAAEGRGPDDDCDDDCDERVWQFSSHSDGDPEWIDVEVCEMAGGWIVEVAYSEAGGAAVKRRIEVPRGQVSSDQRGAVGDVLVGDERLDAAKEATDMLLTVDAHMNDRIEVAKRLADAFGFEWPRGSGDEDEGDENGDDDVVGCACRSCVPWRLGDDEDAAERDVVP